MSTLFQAFHPRSRPSFTFSFSTECDVTVQFKLGVLLVENSMPISNSYFIKVLNLWIGVSSVVGRKNNDGQVPHILSKHCRCLLNCESLLIDYNWIQAYMKLT